MPYFLSKLIRKYLIKLPERMCDKCLDQFTDLTIEGQKLCAKCYRCKIKSLS